jgi:cell wall-associated NlpC family hydrolase
MLFRRHLVLVCICLALAPLGRPQTSMIARLPRTKREDIMARAKKLAAYSWVSSESNLHASCSRSYKSDWKAGQRVTGIPYCWGGIDGPEAFERKLMNGLAAGAHSRNGVLSCATGIDCSGFVALCWGLSPSGHAYSTSNLRDIAGMPKYNVYTDMKPGDALNKAGTHVVLFAGYNPDGTINVYEASGSMGRVVFHKSNWSRFIGYKPLQYKGLDE